MTNHAKRGRGSGHVTDFKCLDLIKYLWNGYC